MLQPTEVSSKPTVNSFANMIATPEKKSGNCESKGCGSSEQEISLSIQERIANHPCYSQDAHHHYARMHAPVAPACNIQCNYCNRKYDCANESRPGVVSELLTPEEAAHKALVIAGKIPQMTVMGIAGPGDPLANPEKTFRTFELVAEKAPDIKLCLSTNGLALPEYVDRIKALNIDHVTLTINMVDPEIGVKIYPWVHYKRKRYRGIEGVKILHQKQMEALDLLREADVLCKVNSVMIPGINDKHLEEVNRVVRSKGAFIHNIMPLISSPEHGTYFGLNGQRGPTTEELKVLQDKCDVGGMKMMRHCRQCRADAVGLLGEDRSKEFTKEAVMDMTSEYDIQKRKEFHAGIEGFRSKLAKAKASDPTTEKVEEAGPPILLAVASKGNGLVNQHFGHAKEFMIYEVDGVNVKFIAHRKVDHYCLGGYGEEGSLQNIIKAISDCKAVLVSKIGDSPKEKVHNAGIEVVETYDVIETVALDFYKQFIGELQPV